MKSKGDKEEYRKLKEKCKLTEKWKRLKRKNEILFKKVLLRFGEKKKCGWSFGRMRGAEMGKCEKVKNFKKCTKIKENLRKITQKR